MAQTRVRQTLRSPEDAVPPPVGGLVRYRDRWWAGPTGAAGPPGPMGATGAAGAPGAAGQTGIGTIASAGITKPPADLSAPDAPVGTTLTGSASCRPGRC